MTSVLAHRGASARCRENTLEAFRAARALGADGVELDVRRSADGVLVVHHDAGLPDGPLVVSLAAAELPGWVPTLDAALEECAGMIVDAEIKNLATEPDFDAAESTAVAAAALVARLGIGHRVVISSFSMASIDAAHETAPEVPTAWLTPGAYDQLDALALAAGRGHAALQPRHEAVTPELVAAVHDRGLEIHAWTVDDPDRISWLAHAGVDAVITNVPDVARAALGR